MKRLGAVLLGDEARFPLEQRIFHILMLMGMALTVFAAVTDALYGIGLWVDLAFLGCWAALFGFSRFGHGFRAVSIIVAALVVFAFIPYQWIVSHGTSSAISIYTALFAAVVCMMLRGPARIMMVISIIAIEALLVGYDAFFIKRADFWDWVLQLTVNIAATALFVIFYSNAYRKEKQRSESYAQAIEASICQQTYYMENLEGLIGRLKSERHDFNNHLGVIHGLLEGGEMDKAKDYAARLVEEAAEYQNIVNVPYPAVRALLNHKLSAARDSGISLKLDIGLPEALNINEFDLTVILGNLLDNAAEACAAMTSGHYIELVLRFQPEYLVIHIANPFTPGYRSAKPHPENHGFGLCNVKYYVNKHDGLMDIKKTNGVFTVDIALPVG